MAVATGSSPGKQTGTVSLPKKRSAKVSAAAKKRSSIKPGVIFLRFRKRKSTIRNELTQFAGETVRFPWKKAHQIDYTNLLPVILSAHNTFIIAGGSAHKAVLTYSRGYFFLSRTREFNAISGTASSQIQKKDISPATQRNGLDILRSA